MKMIALLDEKDLGNGNSGWGMWNRVFTVFTVIVIMVIVGNSQDIDCLRYLHCSPIKLAMSPIFITGLY